MVRRLSIMMLTAVLLITLLPATALAAKVGGIIGHSDVSDLKFKILSLPSGGQNGTVEVASGYTREKQPNTYSRESYNIPGTVTDNSSTYDVTSIGSKAFRNCSALISVTIPDSITSIRNEAFYKCSQLSAVTIPDNVTSIGSHAFYNCSALTSITIPNSVTSIGNNAFQSCSALTSITIPDRVTSIGYSLFQSCSSLISIDIPASVTSIGNNAFSECFSLTSVTIPDSVTSIGSQAFNKCSSLSSVTIPGSVTSIKFKAFNGCTQLATLTVNRITAPRLGNDVFSNCPIAKFYVPADATEYDAAAWPSVMPQYILPPVTQQYTITVAAAPEAGGMVYGGGTFAADTQQKVTASVYQGYTFINWLENNVVMSTDTCYTFILTGNRNLVANFGYIGGSEPPDPPDSDVPSAPGSDTPEPSVPTVPDSSSSEPPDPPDSDVPATSGSDTPEPSVPTVPDSSPSEPPDPPDSDVPATSGSDNSVSSPGYHTLTATSGKGGSIPASSMASVGEDQYKRLTITPAQGFVMAALLVDQAGIKLVIPNIMKPDLILISHLYQLVGSSAARTQFWGQVDAKQIYKN